MSRTPNRNNVMAGTFLIACLAGAMAIVITLSGATERLVAKTAYVVELSIASGATGLEPGSAVALGGQRVGKVTGLEFSGMDDGVPDSVLVSVAIRSDIVINEDAIFTLEVPLLGSGSRLNIVSTGLGMGATFMGSSARLEADERIVGVLAPPSFLAQAGYGPDQAEKVRNIIDRFEESSNDLRRIVADVSRSVPEHTRRVDSILANADTFTADLRERLPGWNDKIDGTLDSARGAVDNFAEVGERAKLRVDEARVTIELVNAAINDNRPRFDEIMENVRSASSKVDSEAMDRVNSTLRMVGDAAERAGAVLADVSAFTAREFPNVSKILANARLASDQLKLTTIEVRQSPWRLLYTPGKKELAEEYVWGAARSYAEAASDLRAASESLEQALLKSNTADPGELSALRDRVRDAMSVYVEREGELARRLFDVKP